MYTSIKLTSNQRQALKDLLEAHVESLEETIQELEDLDSFEMEDMLSEHQHEYDQLIGVLEQL